MTAAEKIFQDSLSVSILTIFALVLYAKFQRKSLGEAFKELMDAIKGEQE